MYTRVIPAHNYGVTEVIQEPTCATTGTSRIVCADCGKSEYETIPALNHKVDEVSQLVKIETASKDPTCTTAGEKVEICTLCRETVKTTIPATGHSIYELDENDEPTTDEVDDYVEGTITSTDDEGFVTVSEGTNPTCEKDLVRAYTCSYCEKQQVELIRKATGHKYRTSKVGTVETNAAGEYVTDEEGNIVVTEGSEDCTHDYVKVFSCSNENCDNVGEETVEVIRKATGHTPDSRTIEIHGNGCTENQTRDYWCTACNTQVYDEIIEKTATGHKFVLVPATCTEAAHIACTKCDVDETEIQALESTNTVKKAYDAFTKALKIKDIKALCGDSENVYSTTRRSALKHTPLTTEAGVAYVPEAGKHQCATCGEKYEPTASNENVSTPAPVELNKTAYNAAKSAVEALTEADYTSDSYKNVTDAVAAADAIVAKANATQAELDAAVTAINDAIAALVNA